MTEIYDDGQSELMLVNNAGGYPTTVAGFVSPANDVVQFGTPAEIVDNLGLTDSIEIPRPGDRPPFVELAFSPDEPVVRAIRFPATEEVLRRVEVPRVSEVGGSGAYDTGCDWPFTGNGFTSSPDAIVPELRIAEPAPIPVHSEMWEIAADGSERLVGVYDGAEWTRVDG